MFFSFLFACVDVYFFLYFFVIIFAHEQFPFISFNFTDEQPEAMQMNLDRNCFVFVFFVATLLMEAECTKKKTKKKKENGSKNHIVCTPEAQIQM